MSHFHKKKWCVVIRMSGPQSKNKKRVWNFFAFFLLPPPERANRGDNIHSISSSLLGINLLSLALLFLSFLVATHTLCTCVWPPAQRCALQQQNRIVGADGARNTRPGLHGTCEARPVSGQQACYARETPATREHSRAEPSVLRPSLRDSSP